MSKYSAIKGIFYGNRGNMESMNIPKGTLKRGDITSDTYDELKAKLSPELFELYIKFTDALEDDHCEEVDFYYTEGFKLGLLVGIECMEE